MTATITRNMTTGMRYELEELFLLLPMLNTELLFAFGVKGNKLFINLELEPLEFI